MIQFDCRTAKTEHEMDRTLHSNLSQAHKRWVEADPVRLPIVPQPSQGAYRVTFGSAPGRTFYALENVNGVLFVAEETKPDHFVPAEKAAWNAVAEVCSEDF
jgi:hypothetical protein